MAITKVTNRVLDDSSVGVAQLSAGAVPTKLGSEIGPFAFRNKIINGNFDIWQRGTSGFVGGVYSADRWRFDYNTNDTITFSRQAFPLGQTDVPGEPTYYARATITAGNTGFLNDFRQRIEDVRTLAGKTVTLSYYIRGSVNATVPSARQRLGQDFGTGGTPSTAVGTDLGSVSVTTSWQKIVRTVILPSIQGKTLGTNNDHFLDVILTLPANVTGTFDIAQVQLEEGSVATPFEQRPIGTELALCQRYYEKNEGPAIQGPGIGGATTAANWQFKVSKRATPTCTGGSPVAAGNNVGINGAYVQATAAQAIWTIGATANAEL